MDFASEVDGRLVVFRGRVVTDERGEPIAGAEVIAQEWDFTHGLKIGAKGIARSPPFTCVTARDGTFSVISNVFAGISPLWREAMFTSLRRALLRRALLATLFAIVKSQVENLALGT